MIYFFSRMTCLGFLLLQLFTPLVQIMFSALGFRIFVLLLLGESCPGRFAHACV